MMAAETFGRGQNAVGGITRIAVGWAATTSQVHASAEEGATARQDRTRSDGSADCRVHLDHADAIFVYDPALVTDQGAVILRMGKALRRG